MSDDMSMGLPSSAGEHGVLRSMQEVAMSSQEASKMLRTYNIAWWGNNYYDVNELGHISVCPDPDVPEARVDLAQLVKTREAQGQRLPALFCFPQILQHRLRSINALAIKLLPEPDSPTRPRISPSVKVILTRSTALTHSSPVLNSMVRLRISSNGIIPPPQ